MSGLRRDVRTAGASHRTEKPAGRGFREQSHHPVLRVPQSDSLVIRWIGHTLNLTAGVKTVGLVLSSAFHCPSELLGWGTFPGDGFDLLQVDTMNASAKRVHHHPGRGQTATADHSRTITQHKQGGIFDPARHTEKRAERATLCASMLPEMCLASAASSNLRHESSSFPP
jgi:hypothetical protein